MNKIMYFQQIQTNGSVGSNTECATHTCFITYSRWYTNSEI